MTFCLRRACSSILQKTMKDSTNTIICRTAIIVERVKQPNLVKKYKIPGRPKLNERYYIYKMVENNNVAKRPDVNCILTEFVEGLGNRGDFVEVNRKYFWEILLPCKMAVYPTPDNIARFEEEREGQDLKVKRSKYALQTLRHLNSMSIQVFMNKTHDWTVDKKHVAISLRLNGVTAPLESITLPKEPITNISEKKQFTFKIKINELDIAEVKAEVVEWPTKDMTKKYYLRDDDEL